MRSDCGLALAGGGSFVTSPLSLHATTNIDVVHQLLGVRAEVRDDGRRARVEVPETTPFWR